MATRGRGCSADAMASQQPSTELARPRRRHLLGGPLRAARRVRRDPVGDALQDGGGVDARVQLGQGGQQHPERLARWYSREALHDAVHEVVLRDLVLAGDHLLERGQHRAAVHLHVHALELTEDEQVLADEVAQLLPLALAPRALRRLPLPLHAHPQLVHAGEVLQREVDGVGERAALALELAARVRQQAARGLREVRPEEEAAGGVLHALAHLDQVLEHLLGRRPPALDVHVPDGHQQV